MMESPDKEFLSHLHHMIKSIDPIIKSSRTLENVDDSLQHLEETDENFHKYDFIQFIRNRLETAVGPNIDEEIEKQSMNSLNTAAGQETLVQLVSNNLQESEEYNEAVAELESLTLKACQTLIQGIEDEHATNIDEDIQSHHSKRFVSGFSEGASTCESSFNHGMFFMSQQQFHKIAEDLSMKQPLAIRREALRHLCQIPPSDVMASESWEHLRISLMDALSDSDTQLAHDALSFHARMFAVSNNNIMRETYTCLAEHLQTVFLSSKFHKALNFSNGLDISVPEITSILKRIRLLNEFQREVPSIWVRYPEYFLEKIIESTLAILSLRSPIASDHQHILTPIHLFALVDTKAHWFRKWLHGNYSRSVLVKLLENAYKQVLISAVVSCKTFADSFLESIKQPSKPHDEVGSKRHIYTPYELQYTVFIYSLSIVSRLLLFSGGRKLFPLSTNVFDDDITIDDLLISWIKILNFAISKPKPVHKSYEPAYLVGKVLRFLFSHNTFVETCVSQHVIMALLEPVDTWLNNSMTTKRRSYKANDYTLLHVSEILSCLSSTPSGRRKLMFGSGNADKRKISSAAHVIAEFAQKCLSGKLPVGGETRKFPTYPVTGSFVFICRQMYNTCSGLLLLNGYKLHTHIANAWKIVHTHHNETTSMDSFDEKPPSVSSSHNLIMWEENLIDNLLNFAATPKGLLLLQQTGTIKECMSYMFSRYTKKLQVSKCEKFGYGVMVTQVAATASGIKALQVAGFERAVVRELWSALECPVDDGHAPVALKHPATPADRAIQKAFYALVNLISSFPAAHEVLLNQSLKNKTNYTFREVPETMADLMDRIVFVNSEAKIHSLFSYEHSHNVGLRLLNILICSLDTLLLLESQYNVQNMLLQMQKDNKTFEGEIIIDELSVERNHIIVRSGIIGGPNERKLPPRTVPFVNASTGHASAKLLWPWPLFDHHPIPKEYTISSPSKSNKKENALSRFLSKTKNVDKNRGWLDQCRSSLTKLLMTSPRQLKAPVVAEMLEKALSALERMPEEHVFPRSINKSSGNVVKKMPNISKIATRLTVQYGKSLNMIKTNSDSAMDHFADLWKSVASLLESQQTVFSAHELNAQRKGYHGHDWFTSTMFIIFGGNKEKTWTFLQKISEFLCSGILWPARLHASVHLPNEVRESGMSVAFYCTGHYVELILQNELPLVYSAFRMSGYTPSQITQHWITQLFWNYLDWSQICQYISLVMVMGSDYQVYFCLSIFKHLKGEILCHRQTQDLQAFLMEQPITDYNISSYMDFMTGLETKYRSLVLPDMRNIIEKKK